MSVRLVLRLLRGNSGAGWLRLGLMALGLAVGTVALLHIALLPTALGSREAVIEARSFAPAGEHGRTAFRVTELSEVWRGVRLTRVFLAQDTDAPPLPPGVVQWPGPGEVILSPALKAAVAGDPELARLVPGRVIGSIDSAGLIEPQERLAYLGSDLLPNMVAASGWGAPLPLDVEWRLGPVAATAILIVPAAVVFLVACTRLASRTRQRRYAELRLLGLRRGRVARVAFLETALVGGVGAIVGALLFLATLTPIATRGWLGLSWYPDVALPPVWVLLLIWAGTSWLCGSLGKAGLGPVIDQPLRSRSDPIENRPRWWALAPLALGLGGVAAALSLRADEPLVMGDGAALATVVAIALVCFGALLAVPHVVVGTGALMARMARWPLWQLGGRRIASAPTRVSRMLMAIGSLVLIIGVGSSVAYAVDTSVGEGQRHILAWLEGADVTPDGARDLAGRRQDAQWVLTSSLAEDPDWVPPRTDYTPSLAEIIRTSGINMIFTTCQDLALAAVVESGTCRPGELHLLHRAETPHSIVEGLTGTGFQFVDDDHRAHTISVPSQRIAVSSGPMTSWVRRAPAILWADLPPATGWEHISLWYFLIEASPDAWEEFRADVAESMPSAAVQSGFENLILAEMAASYRQAIASGGFVAAALVVFALLIVSIDRGLQQRRDSIRLRVLGLRGYQVRAVTVLQIVLPFLAVVAFTIVVAFLAGNAFILINQRNEGWYLEGLARFLGVVPISAAVVSAVLYVSDATHVRAEDLRRE